MTDETDQTTGYRTVHSSQQSQYCILKTDVGVRNRARDRHKTSQHKEQAIPAFILINSNVIGLIFAGLLMLAVILNCFTGVMASTLPAMFPTHIRYSALAAAFNISVLVAGLTPTLAAWLVESSQNLMMPAYYLMVVAVVGLITGVTMKETANRPLKGATPAASDIQEAKEILVEHYDNIEQKIDDIDHEIADLQAKRTRLVQQHPRIDE